MPEQFGASHSHSQIYGELITCAMHIVHIEFIRWFLISKATFPDVECKTRSAGEGFVKVNKGGWDWWSCSQQEGALLHGQEINKRVEILGLAFKNRKWPPVYS